MPYRTHSDLLTLAAILLILVAKLNPMAILKHFDHSLQLITRHNDGDLFTLESAECNLDTCIGFSSGTATLYRNPNNNYKNTCTCQCLGHLTTFRDDLHICVDDIHECALSPFVSGSISHHIPFVILPLKGQIIHPSKEVYLPGMKTPMCTVNGAQFLSDNGWLYLRNTFDINVPFQLFRDEGRTFLQWLGENDLRSKMTGRVILIHLICKDLDVPNDSPTATAAADATAFLFNTCVAFRVVGSPSKYLSNITEVTFASESNKIEESGHLNIFEYLAIICCTIILGLIYVVTVSLYLHLKRRKNPNKVILEESHDKDSDKDKRFYNNGQSPLIKRDLFSKRDYYHHHHQPQHQHNTIFKQQQQLPKIQNGSIPVEDEQLLESLNEKTINQIQTSAQIHSDNCTTQDPNYNKSFDNLSLRQQETNECLPEEELAIFESLEERESESPDTVKSIVNSNQNMRQKLYFNPSYFDPQLLLSPPPAAIEFVTKIREVINMARQKIIAKRFVPSLNEIPEEMYNNTETSGSYQTLKKAPPPKTVLYQTFFEQNEKQDNIKKWLENISVNQSHDNNPVSEAHPNTNTEPEIQDKQHYYQLTDILADNTKTTDYNLVSEVYVNNGFSDANSDISMTSSSTLDQNNNSIRLEPQVEKSKEGLGCLKIEINDCPDHYIPIDDRNSDSFEPDTLEKKNSKVPSVQLDLNNNNNINGPNEEYMDSLERPANGGFVRKPSSLREIYQARIRQNCDDVINDPLIGNGEEFVRILSLEDRHSRRQRKSTLEQNAALKKQQLQLQPHAHPQPQPHPHPDLIPIVHEEKIIYQNPKSSKELVEESISSLSRTKNGISGSTYPLSGDKKAPSNNFVLVHSPNSQLNVGTSAAKKIQSLSLDTLKRIVSFDDGFRKRLSERRKCLTIKYEDSGYLSTDSNESHSRQQGRHFVEDDAISETDESFGDGHSESGAESIETHSVFFNSFRNSEDATLESGDHYFASNNLTIKKVKDSTISVKNY